MKKLLLILVVMSLLSACKTELYAMQPYNPMCLKLEDYQLNEREATILYNEFTPKNRDILMKNKMAIKQECGE